MLTFYLALTFLVVILLAIFFRRFFAWLVELLIQHVLHFDLTLDSFGFLAVNGVTVKLKSGITIEIEKISLQIRWTLSNVKRFTVVFWNVVIIVDKSKSQTRSSRPMMKEGKNSAGFVSSRKETLSRFMMKICQYLAVRVSDLEVVVRDAPVPGMALRCKLHSELNLCATPQHNCLLSVLSVNKIVTQLYTGTADDDDRVPESVVELSVSLVVDFSFVPFESLHTASVHARMTNLGILLSDGLLGLQSSPESRVSSNVDSAQAPHKVDDEQFSQTARWIGGFSEIPKDVEVALDDTTVTFSSQNKRTLVLEVSRVVGNISQNGSSPVPGERSIHLNLGVSGITSKDSNSCKLCTLNRLRLASQVSSEAGRVQMVSTLSIESCHFNYLYEECSYWFEYFKSKRKELRKGTQDIGEIEKSQQPSFFSRIPLDLDITNSVDMLDCSTSLYLTAPGREGQPVCRAVLASFTTNLAMPQSDSLGKESRVRDVSVTARLENAYLYVDARRSLSVQSTDEEDATSYTLPDNPALLPNSNKHVWGRMLALGSCSIKCCAGPTQTSDEQLHVSTTCDMNSLAMQWSHEVCRAVVLVASKFRQNSPKPLDSPTKKKAGVHPLSSLFVDGKLRISGVNLFYLGTKQEGLDSMMARVDVVSAAVTPENFFDGQLHGTKICRMDDLQNEPFKCVVSCELEREFVNIPAITLSHTSEKVPSVSLAEVIITWDPTLHMALYERIQEVTHDSADIKGLLKGTQAPAVEHQEIPEKGQGLTVKCDVSRFKLHMKTSASNSFGVEVGNCAVELQQNKLESRADFVRLFFDEVQIFDFEVASIMRLPNVPELQHARQTFKQLTTPSNRVWIIAAERTCVLFPYKFDFAESRDKLINVFKMVKALHKKPRDASYVEPLPPDLWLQFKDIAFTIEDDPFEVKLRDNYALLMDEMEQCNERRSILKAKLNEIRNKPGNLLTVDKEKELDIVLQQKNAQIYIQRSKSLYAQTPMRTSLMTWEFNGLDLKILADESYHGDNRAVDMMKRIDSDSPYPTAGAEFSTLWCRTVQGRLSSHKLLLRDFPQPIFMTQSLTLSGTLMGAEEKAAERAKRTCTVEVGRPWSDITVHRSLTALKFYYDLDFDMQTLEMAWGVDIEPTLGMISMSFEYLSKPSKDPSKPLPFYDKIRLLQHGRLHWTIKEWFLKFSATRDPYDTTERMDVEWRQVDFEWTNGKIVIDGDFDLHTRAASKYDDRRVLHLPAFRVCTNMEWHCSSHPNDHHSVMPCAPDKVPEHAPNQVHDSYTSFRSRSLNLHLALETSMKKQESGKHDPPSVFLYASTFRWLQKYQANVLRKVSLPIKRGTFFKRERIVKKSLGRHYKQVSLSLKFPEVSACYWASFTQQRGWELTCGSGCLETVYCLQLREFSDGLVRRPAADWSATKLRVDISNVNCDLYGLEEFDGQEETQEMTEVSSIDLEPTKYYLLKTARLEYARQDESTNSEAKDCVPSPESRNYNHRLVCHDLKGAWTPTNRKIAFGLFEAYTNAQVLKKNLSANALKFVTVDKKEAEKASSETYVTPSRHRTGSLLEKLVMEQSSKFIAFAEEGTGEGLTETPLQGVIQCNIDDVIEERWHIELVNSQIMLKGLETKGCVLVAAGNATILNRLHRPVWSKGELFNKKTWIGNVENVQYFATVSSEDTINPQSGIPWLGTSVITGRHHRPSVFGMRDLADIVGSGEAVGGVLTSVVGGGPGEQGVPQLQRIVSRCSCEFYFVSFSLDLDPVAKDLAPSIVCPSPAGGQFHGNSQGAVSTFTIRHKLLEISTNSAQYAMLIDITNNVVLYTEPKKKEVSERLQRMRFHMVLSASGDQRGEIQALQNTVRKHQAETRRLERELYEVNLVRRQTIADQEMGRATEATEAVIQLEKEIAHMKGLLNSSSTELRIMISAYKDFMMNLNTPTPEKARASEVVKLAEVYFNHASWRLNQEDGQLEIADATLNNFSYRKTTLNDSTQEHKFELGRFNLRNLQPNSVYKDVLSPMDLSGRGHVDRSVMVRVFSRVRPPVGGIGVKEHFEVNVCPLAVRLTHRLFKKVMAFFFPNRAHEYDTEQEDLDLGWRAVEQQDEKDSGLRKALDEKDLQLDEFEDISMSPPKPSSLRRSQSSLSSSSETSLASCKRGAPSLSSIDAPPTTPKDKQVKKKSTFFKKLEEYDDLEKMKERAAKNHSFIYVKVPEVLLLVSYKGEKEKNIVDVHEFSLVLPTLEYHNRTWTWHDLLMAMKKDCVNVLVSQVIKEKLHLKGGHGGDTTETKSQTREEDKARLLFGYKPMGPQKKTKKSLFKKLTKIRPGSKRSGLLNPDGACPEPVDFEGEKEDEHEEDEKEEEEEERSTDTRDG